MAAPARRRFATLGAALIFLGAALLAFPLLFVGYGAFRQDQLAKAPAPWKPARVPAATASLSAVPASAVPAPALGQVMAYLRIPHIGVGAAVLQGTSDAVLATAPGHEPQSVMPGAAGTSVIVAHNLTFFRHIDALRPGDLLLVGTAQGTFTFAVQRALVVPADSSLPNTAWPSLDLVACYPLDALYYTSQRYVVEAELVSASHRAVAGLRSLKTPPPQFVATLPASLASSGLWLSDTNFEVGSARFTGGPSLHVTATGASWSLTAQSIRMFTGTLRALAVGSPSPLAGFGPNPERTGLTGSGPWSIEPLAPLDVTVEMGASGLPVQVTVRTPRARIATGGHVTLAPYAVTLAVRGDVLYLKRAAVP